MAERRLPVFGLGTYYTNNCPTPGANAHEMRELTYHVKGKYSADAIEIGHMWHPSQGPTRIRNSADGRAFFADCIAYKWDNFLQELKVQNGQKVSLVPVPSSQVTASTMGDRWGGGTVAELLEARGCGVVRPCIVQKTQSIPKADKGASTFEQILANMTVLEEDLPAEDEPVLLIDDLLTWGSHLAICDHLLEESARTIAVTVSVADSKPRDALIPRRRYVVYDSSAPAGASWRRRVED